MFVVFLVLVVAAALCVCERPCCMLHASSCAWSLLYAVFLFCTATSSLLSALPVLLSPPYFWSNTRHTSAGLGFHSRHGAADYGGIFRSRVFSSTAFFSTVFFLGFDPLISFLYNK
jgi:hypothetical protein